MKKNQVFFILFFCLNLYSVFYISPAVAAALPVNAAFEKLPGRPNPEVGPTPVSVAMWLIDIDSINSAQQNFTVNVFVVLQWKDPRLAHSDKAIKRYPTSEIWTPRIQIANEIGFVRRTMDEVADVDVAGNVIYRQRFVGPLSQPLNLRDFPFDKSCFRIHLISTAASMEDIKFRADEEKIKRGLPYAAGISKDISLPDWKVENYSAQPLAYSISDQIQTPGYAFEFTASRDSRHFVVKVISPLILIVMMSWVAFWIDPKETGSNISAVMTSMLTLVAYRFTFESYVPKVGYLTRIDKFTLLATLMVFFSMVQVVANCSLVAHGYHRIAIQIDYWGRLIYPILFLGIIYWAFSL